MGVLMYMLLVVLSLSTSFQHHATVFSQKPYQVNLSSSQLYTMPFLNCMWYSFNMGLCYNTMTVLKLKILPQRNKSNKILSHNSNNINNKSLQTISGSTTIEATIISATSSTSPRTESKSINDIDFLSYHSLERIYKYITSLPWKYPSVASLKTIGKSFEGRDLKLLKVTTGDVGAKTAIFIVGGMQGNNRISSAAVLYTIQQLVENPANSYLLGKADWFLIPIANPDGYEYSYYIDQNWTKTLSLRPSLGSCTGVDLNNNFYTCSYNNSCSNLYAGPEPFSENESKAIKDYIVTYKYFIQLYINIDGYGQSIEFPVEDTERFVGDSSDLKYLASQVKYAMEKYGGHSYKVESLKSSCGSEQWARAMGIKYSYKFRLPAKLNFARKSGKRDILPFLQDIFVAFREIHRTAVAIYSVTYDLMGDI